MKHLGIGILAVVLFGCPWTASGDVFGDFEYTSDGESVTITGYTGSGGDVVIPESIDALAVTVIGREAFSFNTDLTSVSIPLTVVTIENLAFYSCSSLRSMHIPDQVRSIGIRSLTLCRNLEAIRVDEANAYYKDIDGVLFTFDEDTLLQFPGAKSGAYTIPESVGIINAGAFQGCGNVTSVSIPRHVSRIGNSAFSDCSNLTAITVADENEYFDDIDGVLFDKRGGTWLRHYPGGRSGMYSIPLGVTRIGIEGFYNCDGLTEVVVPAGVVMIRPRAFYDCDGLTSIILPSGLEVIGSAAFFHCDNLSTVTIGSGLEVISESALGSCARLESVFCTGDAPNYDLPVFDNSTNVTVYYLPSMTGWGDTYADRPAVLWNPVISDPTPGVGESGFSFQITGSDEIPIAVEATDDLLAGTWTILGTNTLAGGTLDFEDEDGGNFGNRVYRIAAP